MSESTKQSIGTHWIALDGEDWCDVRHGRLIITPDGTVKEEEAIGDVMRHGNVGKKGSTLIASRHVLRGFAKLKKFQKSKNNLDRAQPTHPPPYPIFFFFWKPISGMARTLKSQLLITYRQNTSHYAHTT